MSRGGRGAYRARAGRPKGPDVEWEDEPVSSHSTKPLPLFPPIDLPEPAPFTEDEIQSVNDLLAFRDTLRNGPLYTTLEPSDFTDERGKVNKRAGFDPFTGVERYSSRFHKPRRKLPDFSGRPFNLEFLPQELWYTVDPKKTDPLWKTIPPKSTASEGQKRKRPLIPEIDEEDERQEGLDDVDEREEDDRGSEADDESDSDAPLTASRGKSKKRQKQDHNDSSGRQSGQKRGLEAEDDIADVEQDEEDDQKAEDIPQDSDFEEGSEDDVDDYNAEQYFESGEGDDFEDGGGGGGDDVYD